MAIVGTFNGLTIVATPLVTAPGGPGPRSIEETATNLVGSTRGTYTGQRQTFNWRSGWASRTVNFPPMTRAQADPWIAFLKDCEGTVNAFQLPNPLAATPKGTVTGSSLPVVSAVQPAPLLRGAYSAAVPYSLNDGVTYNGAAYVYIAAFDGNGNFQPDTSPTKWQPVGPWNAAVAYGLNQTVTYGGSTWIYIAAANGNGNYQPDTSPAKWRTLVTAPLNQPLGQTLQVRGWKAGQARLLLPNDDIQIGYRRYSVLDAVSADSYGVATLRLWPRLRETPADGTPVKVSNIQGLYQLAGNDRKWSLNENRTYSVSFSVVEVLPV